MKVTYKQVGYDKEVYCNKAKTNLIIATALGGGFDIYFNDTKLKYTSYLVDAKILCESLLILGVGRNFKEEK